MPLLLHSIQLNFCQFLIFGSLFCLHFHSPFKLRDSFSSLGFDLCSYQFWLFLWKSYPFMPQLPGPKPEGLPFPVPKSWASDFRDALPLQVTQQSRHPVVRLLQALGGKHSKSRTQWSILPFPCFLLPSIHTLPIIPVPFLRKENNSSPLPQKRKVKKKSYVQMWKEKTFSLIPKTSYDWHKCFKNG